MSERIFISYRRDDSRGYAGRLQSDLSRRFANEAVYRDVETPPGVDFGEHIASLVDRCNVVLAIIGPGWLDARDRDGRRRLDDPMDWVRVELERALVRDDAEVIPVLVDGAQIPRSEELPPALAALCRRNAFELSDRRWAYDVEQLASHLDDTLYGTSAVHAPETVTADHTPTAVLAGAAAALVSAIPADLIARGTVHRGRLVNDFNAVSDFALEKVIVFGIVGALAALVVGMFSRRSREPLVSCVLGMGAGIVAGAVYAGAYAGGYLGAGTTTASSTAIGMIAAGAFLGWAFAADRAGSRVEASCGGLAGGLLAAAMVGFLHASLTGDGGHRVLTGGGVAMIVAVAGWVGLRVPRAAIGRELLTPVRAAPPAMNR
jgi:TIR domain